MLGSYFCQVEKKDGDFIGLVAHVRGVPWITLEHRDAELRRYCLLDFNAISAPRRDTTPLRESGALYAKRVLHLVGRERQFAQPNAGQARDGVADRASEYR